MSATQPDYGGQPPYGNQPPYGGQPPRRSRGLLYAALGIVMALILAAASTAVVLASTGEPQPNPPTPTPKEKKKERPQPNPPCGLATPVNCPPPPPAPQPPVPPPPTPTANLDPNQVCTMLTQHDPALVKLGEDDVDGVLWSEYDYAPGGAGDGVGDVAATQDGDAMLILVVQKGSWDEAIGGTCQGGIFTPLA